jgi:hypothetical protein
MVNDSPLSEPEYWAVLAFGEAMEREMIAVSALDYNATKHEINERIVRAMRDAIRAYDKSVWDMAGE